MTSPLDALARALESAAAALEHGNSFQRAWARHLLVDRKAMLMMAVTFRPTEKEEVQE